jgi:hypothetical protein
MPRCLEAIRRAGVILLRVDPERGGQTRLSEDGYEGVASPDHAAFLGRLRDAYAS